MNMRKNTVGYTESVNFRCLEDLEQVRDMGILNPINLNYCGRENCLPGFCFGPYIRNNYVIHLITEGKGEFVVNNITYKLSRNDAFLICPGQETIYRADFKNPWSYLWLGFRGYKEERLLSHIGFNEKKPVISLNNTEKITDMMDKLLDAKQLTFVNELRRSSLFYEILALIVEGNQARDKRAEQDYSDVVYVKRALDIIFTSYQRRLKISEIADEIGINRSYFTNIFKKEMNVSPQQFLINFRMEKAAQLLRETEDPVGTVAISVGYTDALSFSKAFKQKYGINPSQYRQSKPGLEELSLKGDYISQNRL